MESTPQIQFTVMYNTRIIRASQSTVKFVQTCTVYRHLKRQTTVFMTECVENFIQVSANYSVSCNKLRVIF